MKDDISDELQSHLDMHTADNIRAGMTPEEARRRALVALGGLAQTKERYRDQRGFPTVDALWQDLRLALRTLHRAPKFTGAAVTVLAVGIGLTVLVFALANWTLLRPVPGVRRDPESVSIIGVGTWRPTGPLTGSLRVSSLSYPNYHDIARRLTTIVRNARAEWEVLAQLAGFLSAVAIFLTSCGLYAVMAFVVTARRREFGIRMALGATRGQVSRLVARRTAAIVAAGTAAGLGAASALTGIIANRLVGVDQFDPIAWSAAALILIAVMFAASFLPIRNATTVNVADTLKTT